jgi:hypothetical protein
MAPLNDEMSSKSLEKSQRPKINAKLIINIIALEVRRSLAILGWATKWRDLI